MTVFDYVALGILGVSVGVSLWRGMLREILALAAWVIAFLVAQYYAAPVAPLLPAGIPGAELRLVIGFVSVFVGTLLGMSLIVMAVSAVVKKAGLDLADRLLGAVFGLARGILIVLVLVLLGGLTALPREPAWRDAMLAPPFEALALAVKPWLPADFARRIRYD